MRSVNNTVRAASQRHQKHRVLKVPARNQHYITLAPINRFVQIKDYAKRDNHYKLGKIIGSGSNAQVYEAMNMNNGEVVACKKILLKFKNQQKLESELEFLTMLEHKNVIKYIFHEITKDYLLIYQEYMPMGSMQQLLNDIGPMKESVIKQYAIQILDGLEYLHNQGILHLDLKSSNILLDSKGHAKISDFGCSRRHSPTLFQSVLQGSIPWMAPEVARQESLGAAADIWSFGCIMVELITAKCPWNGQINFDNPATTLLKIALTEESHPIPEFVSMELKNFLSMCFSLDPCKRASILQLKQSAFLQ